MILINHWRCGCVSEWWLTTDSDSDLYRIEKSIIQADVENHRAKCKKFEKYCTTLKSK